MNVRSLLAVALAALLVPLAASAQTRRSSTARPAASNALAVGGWVGYESGDADGFQLRLDGELPFQQLTPQIKLSLVGSIGYTFAEYDVFGTDVSVDRLKIVPAARFTLPVNPQLSLFGDAGLGLHYTTVSIEGFDGDDSELGLMLRLAAGGFFQVNPQVRLGAQLVLDPMFGDYDDTTFAIMVGAMFTL